MTALSEQIDLRTHAESKIKGQEQILLSPQDWVRLAEILDDDAPPNAKLYQAAEKYNMKKLKQLFG
ncbi:MAG: DUF1778 domain-containing protein [Candidatus Thiothrix moscowensis]|nr:DUF1778 domain-containing protein [Candidatus Thiothrix moscowensis]